MLLPHEIVATFLSAGETFRMIGDTVAQQRNTCLHLCMLPVSIWSHWLVWQKHHIEDLALFWEKEKNTRWVQDWIHACAIHQFELSDCGQPRTNKDPCCNLSKAIPVRLYGDGAESQRPLSAFFYLVCSNENMSTMKLSKLASESFHAPLNFR